MTDINLRYMGSPSPDLDNVLIKYKDMGDGTHALVYAVVPSGIPSDVFSELANGELAGSAVAVRMPDVPCKMVKFKAQTTNAGYVYIGGPGVTVPNGATDVTTGLELLPGDETGWIPIDNLNRFWRICNNAGDDLTYLAMVS
jgi:hypothetical protein